MCVCVCVCDDCCIALSETTLIHVLAEFGLQKIIQQILKLPEATQVVIRLNVQGLLPEEIAEKHGHKELSRMLGK